MDTSFNQIHNILIKYRLLKITFGLHFLFFFPFSESISDSEKALANKHLRKGFSKSIPKHIGIQFLELDTILFSVSLAIFSLKV